MDITEIGWKVVDGIHLDQRRFQWLALVNTAMTLRVPYALKYIILYRVE